MTEVEQTVLGIAIVRRKFLFGDYLELLGIAPSATGTGLGTGSGHIESLTFARAKNVFACVSDFNEVARAFYRKQGYKEIGPCRIFSFQAMPRFCFVRRLVRQGQRR